MLRNEPKQLSLSHSLLYSSIPENHILKRINSAIDLSFVTDLLESSYNKYYGRPAKDPEMMLRILILKHLYNMSDQQVMEELSMHMGFKWFVGLDLEDPLPETSLLTKFRTQRLKDITVDTIIIEVVKQCVEKGLVERKNGVVIDATHIEANTTKKFPERIMGELAEKIYKAKGQEKYEIPDYAKIKDHYVAKKIMKEFLEEVIDQAKEETAEEVVQAVKEAQNVLNSELFMEQKGIRSLADQDARVGHKSKEQSFYGYKVELCQTTDGSLITSAIVAPGSYVDGVYFNEHIENTDKTGLNMTGVYGDKAYFRPDILDIIKEKEAEAFIPVSGSAYRINEELFSYNKDSDQWFCVQGNETVKVKAVTRKRQGEKEKLLEYTFEREHCRNCPHRSECMGKAKRVSRLLRISVNTPELYEYSQRAKTPEFHAEYRKRAKIEPKNAELKRFHGLNRAKGFGLKSISIQAKLTVLAVNLKRIAKMVSASNESITHFLCRFRDLLRITHKMGTGADFKAA